MHNPDWTPFGMRVLLNRPDAYKRWADSLVELNRVGLFNVIRFASLPDIGPHQSFNSSVNAIIKAFYNSKEDTLLFMEDDIVFKNVDHLDQAIKELPDNWDILYLGANLITEQIQSKPERYSKHLCRIQGAWTTHAIVIRKPIAKFIIDNQPGPSEQMVDNWLSANLHRFNAFCVTPMIAYQRPDLSYIWNQHVNYDRIFEETDKLLLNTK